MIKLFFLEVITIRHVETQMDVLLPFHRNDDYLTQAINSVLASKDIRLNLILIDDSLKGISSINVNNPERHRIFMARTSGGVGYGGALSEGSKFLQSTRVSLMNSDDLISPIRFCAQLKALGTSELSITGIQRVRSDGNISRSLSGGNDMNSYNPVLLLLGAYGANSTWATTRKWWEENMFFDNKPALDWRIALQTFHKTKIEFLPDTHYFYRKHSDQHTSLTNHSEDYSFLYESWSELANQLFGEKFNYQVFQQMGMPWLKQSSTHSQQLTLFVETFEQYIDALYPSIKKSAKAVLRRRILFSIWNSRSIANFRFKQSIDAAFEFPNLLRDLVVA